MQKDQKINMVRFKKCVHSLIPQTPSFPGRQERIIHRGKKESRSFICSIWCWASSSSKGCFAFYCFVCLGALGFRCWMVGGKKCFGGLSIIFFWLWVLRVLGVWGKKVGGLLRCFRSHLNLVFYLQTLHRVYKNNLHFLVYSPHIALDVFSFPQTFLSTLFPFISKPPGRQNRFAYI